MPVTVSLADYGVGNLHSIRKALEDCGGRVDVVTDMEDLIGSECIVFPGVGAFDRTMERLTRHRDGIRRELENGTPALGICIGTHILFEDSEEGSADGMGFIRGHVRRLGTERVPHMGWNTVVSDDPVFDGIPDRHFYFAHSFYGDPDGDETVGSTEYEGMIIPSVFRRRNVYGCQFHPEKSSASGIRFLRNFLDFAGGLP